MQESAFDQIKRLEMYVLNILSRLDIDVLERHEQKLVLAIRRQFTDSKLDVRDYEFAETRVEQTELAKAAIKSLETVRATILAASEHYLFSAVDVAMLSAQLEVLVTELAEAK